MVTTEAPACTDFKLAPCTSAPALHTYGPERIEVAEHISMLEIASASQHLCHVTPRTALPFDHPIPPRSAL